MSFPKKGRKFPRDLTKMSPVLIKLIAADGEYEFTSVISTALKEEFGSTHAAVKTVALITGAGERTVRNWFQAKNGPNGRFFIHLVMHSDLIFETFLVMANRQELLLAKKLVDAREELAEILNIIDKL